MFSHFNLGSLKWTMQLSFCIVWVPITRSSDERELITISCISYFKVSIVLILLCWNTIQVGWTSGCKIPEIVYQVVISQLQFRKEVTWILSAYILSSSELLSCSIFQYWLHFLLDWICTSMIGYFGVPMFAHSRLRNFDWKSSIWGILWDNSDFSILTMMIANRRGLDPMI